MAYDKYDIRSLHDDEYPNVGFGHHVDMELTDEQKTALFQKWKQDANGMEWRDFAKTVVRFDFGAVGVQWCGMWVGIEKDGHAHT